MTDNPLTFKTYKFRKRMPKSKIKGGEPVYVEKSKYAIDNQGELSGITAKGLAAKRKKERTPKIFNNKPKRKKKLIMINNLVFGKKPKKKKSKRGWLL